MTILSNRARIAGLAAALAAVMLLAAPGFARADAVRDWNLNATTALAAQDARVSVLHLAMVHGAVFDAVNAIDHGYRPYLVSPRAKPWDSPDAAAATAAYRVLVGIVPEQKPALEALYCVVIGRHPRRSHEGGRHPRRRDGCSGDDRRAGERWALRLSGLSDRHDAGPVAAGPAHVRQRPVRLDQERDTVPHQGRVAVPLAWPVPARKPEIRSGLRGGEGRRLRDEHDAYRRSDQRRSLLGPRIRRPPGTASLACCHFSARGCRWPTTPATSRCCT